MAFVKFKITYGQMWNIILFTWFFSHRNFQYKNMFRPSKVLFIFKNKPRLVEELCPQSLPSTMDENKSTKTWSAWGEKVSQRRRAKSLFLNGLLLGSVCTGIQVKLISHCQAVRIKQQVTFKELWELILSQGQLAKGLWNFGKQTHFMLGPLSENWGHS